MDTSKLAVDVMDRSSKQLLFLGFSTVLHLSVLSLLFLNFKKSSEGDFAPSHLESFEVISPNSSQRIQNLNSKGVERSSKEGAPEVENSSSAGGVTGGRGSGSGEIQPPRLVRAAPIEYPEAARRSGKEGQVVAFLSLDERGKVIQVEIDSSSDSDFLVTAKEGLSRYEFTPARKLGEPIPIRIRYVYRFQLKSM